MGAAFVLAGYSDKRLRVLATSPAIAHTRGDYNTEETCYNLPSCALVGIKYSNLCPWCASSNSFPLTTCICLYKHHRLPMEAALVQQVKNGAAQVSYLR